MKRNLGGLGVGLVALLLMQFASAQDIRSLETTYAALCTAQADQQGETCVALREAIANKPSPAAADMVAGTRSADNDSDVRSWGLLARLADTTWIAGPHPDGTVTIHKYSRIEDGTAIELRAYTPGLPLGLRIAFRKGTQPGLLHAEVHELGDEKAIPVAFRADADSLQSDWYRFAATLGMGGVSLKKEITLSSEGRYVYLQGYGRGSERPAPVDGFPGGFVQYATADVEAIEAKGKVAGEAAMAQAYRDLAAEKRRKQQERAARFNSAMESIQGALVAAGEVAEANEARSRAELDATLAQVAAAQQTTRQRSAPSEAVASTSTNDGVTQPQSRARAEPALPLAAATQSSARNGPKFGWCVAIQPSAYLDAPGAMFLSKISQVDWSGYQASAAADAFGAAVSARYGAHPGSVSCNSWGNRAEAESRWREQHDTVGLSAYKKVETGLPAGQ